MRNAAFSGKVAKDVSRQHALTVQKNSRNCVMAHQKTAKIVVKTELESPHQKIQKAEWIAKIAVTGGNRDCESRSEDWENCSGDIVS